MSAGFKVVAEAAEQQSHPSPVDYCSLWSFICPRMNGRQRQQAVILRATTAAPDPRWNETSKSKPTISIKTPVTPVDGGSKLIERLVITTVHDADAQSLSVRPGAASFPRASGRKKGFWWWSVWRSIPDAPLLKGESYRRGERWTSKAGEGEEKRMRRRKLLEEGEEEEEGTERRGGGKLMIRDTIAQEGVLCL